MQDFPGQVAPVAYRPEKRVFMKIQQFLEHHGIACNPFADEDAQTDLVFKGHCIRGTFHPAWDKIFGDPHEPATSVVLGEKGSGKTALGLQVIRHLGDFNREHPGEQIFVVLYDDFNPYLDRFRDRFRGRNRRIDRALAHWKLWDHMDAILALAVTQLVDRVLEVRSARHPGASESTRLSLPSLDRSQCRDLLLLAACYDQSTGENRPQRWSRLARRLRFSTWRSWWDMAVGVAGTLAVVLAIVLSRHWGWLGTVWLYLFVAAAWVPRAVRCARAWWTALRIRRNTRVLNQDGGVLRRTLLRFTRNQVAGQPLPVHDRTDDRYALWGKLQNILGTLGFSGTVVLVDRLDEPYLINGSPDLMRALLWPMLDNKFLKQPGIGFKLFLPVELSQFIDRENREFYERARLDKQNLIRSLQWTGQALYDVGSARLRACAADGRSPALGDMFEESIDHRRLLDAFASLRVPRHLFKFMYRLLTAHCNSYTEHDPQWRISSATFESTLALYQREQDAFDRGVGAV